MRAPTTDQGHMKMAVAVPALLILTLCVTSLTHAAGSDPKADWEKLVAAAQKDGRVSLIVSGWSATTRNWAIATLREKFGIAAEVDNGPSAQQIEKLLQQRRAGLYQFDVFVAGTSALTALKEAGALEPLPSVLFLPEVVDPKLWGPGGRSGPYWDLDKKIAASFGAVTTAVVVNEEMVKPDDFKSYGSLLEPFWKGKMVMKDPTTLGKGEATAVTMLLLMGEEYLRKLAQQEPVLSRDDRLSVEWVARKKYPVGVALPEDKVAEFQRLGVKLAPRFMEEGEALTNATGNGGLINRAPHPNSARVFLNWLLTREAQEQFSKVSGYASRRLDVTNEWLGEMRYIPGRKYLAHDEDLVLARDQYRKVIKQVFLPLSGR